MGVRSLILSACGGALAVLAASAIPVSSQGPIGAPPPVDATPVRIGGQAAAASAAGDMIVHTAPLASGRTQVVVVDVGRRALAVYHVEPDQGVIGLKSVRNITADLQLDEFNTAAPLPAEVRGVTAP